jgi:hypothetical protein
VCPALQGIHLSPHLLVEGRLVILRLQCGMVGGGGVSCSSL